MKPSLGTVFFSPTVGAKSEMYLHLRLFLAIMSGNTKTTAVFWRVTVILVHAIFLGVFIGFNFDTHTGAFSSLVQKEKKSVSVRKGVQKARPSAPQKPSIRLNKRFQPEGTPVMGFFPGLPIRIETISRAFISDDDNKVTPLFHSFLHRGPPRVA